VVTRQGATVAIVATHAGRVFGVVAQGPDAGDVVVEAFVDGIIWSDPLAPGDGYVYFGADDDTLYAMAIDDGRLAWSTRLGECTPARAAGPVGLRCDVDGGPALGPGGDLMVGADGLYRVGRDGAVKWRFPDDEASPRYHVASRPVATERVIVFGAQDGYVHAVDPEGHERWSVEIGGDVDSDGVVAADGSIVIGGDNGRVYALDPDDGATRWAFATGRDVRGGIALGPDGGLFAASLDGNLYALSGSGAVRFIVPTQGPIASTPVVDEAGVVYFGSRDDRLYAVTGDGVVRWNLELPDDLDAGVAITPDGTIVVACDDGMLRGLQ
jgi:outer membrane protein assembly factor BamB